MSEKQLQQAQSFQALSLCVFRRDVKVVGTVLAVPGAGFPLEEVWVRCETQIQVDYYLVSPAIPGR